MMDSQHIHIVLPEVFIQLKVVRVLLGQKEPALYLSTLETTSPVATVMLVYCAVKYE